MAEKHYKLRILPLFEDDLNEVVDYISIHLQNPIAAENFVDAVETAMFVMGSEWLTDFRGFFHFGA